MPTEDQDIGDGLTRFRAGEQVFHVDLVAEVAWYMQEGPTWAEKGIDSLAIVQERVLRTYGVRLNHSQADAYLHALNRAYRDLKKKQADELS